MEQRIKVALTLWMVGSIGVAVSTQLWGTIPLLLLFAAGWGWLAVGGNGVRTKRGQTTPAAEGQVERRERQERHDQPAVDLPPRSGWTEPVGVP